MGELYNQAFQNIEIPQNQQSLGQMAFESQVDPFRRGFEDRLKTSIEDLSRRGVQFGGVANESIADLLKSETAMESDIAKSIGSQLGKTLLDQAFQSSERAQRFEEQKALGEMAFGQQKELGDIEKQYQRNNQAINLMLSGNLKGEAAQKVLDEAFGTGFVLTTEDELGLQQAASAAGLTTEEFQAVRRTIGEAQKGLIEANPLDFIEDPAKQRAFQKELAQIAVQGAQDAAKTGANATKAASSLALAGTGAQLGFNVGGPWGALIGGGIGLLTGTLFGGGE